MVDLTKTQDSMVVVMDFRLLQVLVEVVIVVEIMAVAAVVEML